MAPSYKFSIIQARPDAFRGERVNVGIAIQTESKLDIRLPELRKLKPLTGHGWDEIARVYSESFARADVRVIEGRDKSIELNSEVFILGEPGVFVASSQDEYESRVRSILNHFVFRPKLSRKEKTEKINSEIARALKNVGVLARPDENINDGKIISRFVVSEEKDIIADFAYKTNVLKVVSTLDLRVARPAHSRACEKGATLYFAKQKFGDGISTFGVYAANSTDIEVHKSEIEILRGFAGGDIFNWSDARDRQRFTSALY